MHITIKKIIKKNLSLFQIKNIYFFRKYNYMSKIVPKTYLNFYFNVTI